MKEVKYVKIDVQLYPIENYVNEHHEIFISKYDGGFDTIEEIRDEFLEDYPRYNRVEFVEVSTYASREKLDKEEFIELIGGKK